VELMSCSRNTGRRPHTELNDGLWMTCTEHHQSLQKQTARFTRGLC